MTSYSKTLVAILFLCGAENALAVNPLTLGGAILQAEKSLNSVVDNSRQAGDFLIARTAQELLFLIDTFEASNERLLKMAFKSVSQERRQFIGGIEKAIVDLNHGAVKTLNRSERVVDQAYQLVKDVTFDTYPTIFRFRGSVVVPGETADIRLRIRGANLSHGQPYFVLDGKSYAALKPTTQDLVVTIPRSVVTHEEKKIAYKNGKLKITYNAGGFLGFFTEEKTVTYDISLIILPKHLGSISIQYDVLETTHREKLYTGEWHHQGRSGCKDFRQTPAAKGRRFDPDRSSITRRAGSSRGKGESITIKDTVMSMKICVSRNPWNLDKDNGFAHYVYRFVEIWTEPTVTPTSTAISADWLIGATATIGKNVDHVLVTFTDFTDNATNHTPSHNPLASYGKITIDDQGIILFQPIIPGDLAAL